MIYDMLVILNKNTDIRTNSLTRGMGISNSTLIAHTSRLIDQGLVELKKITDAGVRKKRQYYFNVFNITVKGRECLHRLEYIKHYLPKEFDIES